MVWHKGQVIPLHWWKQARTAMEPIGYGSVKLGALAGIKVHKDKIVTIAGDCSRKQDQMSIVHNGSRIEKAAL